MKPTDPAGQQNRPRVVLLATDRSNSVIGEIVDSTVNAIAYSAYGEQSARQDVATRVGFNGELRETTFGWYLLGNGYRAYNPRLMRFHSPDSWSPFGGGGLNPYMYCVGDPVNRSDPTGHYSFLDFIFDAHRFFSGEPGPRVSGGGGKLLAAGLAVASRAPAPGGRSSTPIGGSPAIGEHGTTTTKRYPGYQAAAASASIGASRRSSQSTRTPVVLSESSTGSENSASRRSSQGSNKTRTFELTVSGGAEHLLDADPGAFRFPKNHPQPYTISPVDGSISSSTSQTTSPASSVYYPSPSGSPTGPRRWSSGDSLHSGRSIGSWRSGSSTSSSNGSIRNP
ncbi:MAG: sugar-binding protein [Pseudomonas sp.]|nr:sugar-binding protein [Pseudomonas sp.]